MTIGVVLALLGAGVWFVFEMRASGRRRDGVVAGGYFGVPPGWVPASGDASADLAKQLVRLTEIIVELTTTRRDERELSDDRPRARSPDAGPAAAPTIPLPFRPFEDGELRFARAGPAPPAPGPPAEPPVPKIEQPEVVRSASPTPGFVAPAALHVVADPDPEPAPDPDPAPRPPTPSPPPRTARSRRTRPYWTGCWSSTAGGGSSGRGWTPRTQDSCWIRSRISKRDASLTASRARPVRALAVPTS